tara:strand:- start:556 stop:1467 length:912 start_codon:yes stop_codon:yes gene_type:complete
MENYYQILGLEYGATLEEVEKKYNELLNEFDPDKQSEDLKEFFKSEQDRVNEAYTAISDSLKRIHENLEIIDEVQLSYQTLKLSKDATLAEINNKYKLLLDELNPNNHSNDLKNFFKSEQDKINEAYNIIIKFLANQKSNELLDADSIVINETSNFVDESNLNIHSNLDYYEKLIITDIMKEHLSKMAYWAKLFGVLGFIVSALMLVVAIGMFFLGSEIGDMYGLGAMAGFLYIILGLIYFFPSKYIYGFSKQCRLALNTNSQASISDAFDNLASVFTFWGVSTVIILGIYALGIFASATSVM